MEVVISYVYLGCLIWEIAVKRNCQVELMTGEMPS